MQPTSLSTLHPADAVLYHVLFSASLAPERLTVALDLPAVEVVLLEPQRRAPVAEPEPPHPATTDRAESIASPCSSSIGS
jgi:hypothetical protein